MGLHTKQIFLSSTIREFAGKNNAICIKIRFSRRWMGRGWVDRKAGLLRCRLALGEAPGLRRGAAAFGGRGAAPGPPLGLPNKRARPGPKAPGSLFQGASRPAAAPPALGFAPLPRWSRGNGVPGGEGVRNGACASCAGGRCPRFYGSSPGDRRSADRTYRKGTGGLPAFQRGKGRY